MGGDWPTAAPTEVGLSADLLDRFEQTVVAGQAPDLHGAVVVRHGRVVLARYFTGEDFSWARPLGPVAFGPDTLHDLRSVSKSMVSLLYGIALDAGQVPDLSEPLVRFFPECSELAADPQRARLTVSHALTMTLGLDWHEDAPYTSLENSEIAMEFSSDRHRFILGRPVVEEPGLRWSYSGGATALVGGLITRGTGQPLPAFARAALFGPLGIDAFEWNCGADGVASAASGLRMAPRDIARIGQLVLDGGCWLGRQLVPAEWLDHALRPQVRIDEGFHYGYQWYLAGAGQQRWIGGIGNGGQRLFVFPELKLVVAITAGGYDSADQAAAATAIVDEVVLPSVER